MTRFFFFIALSCSFITASSAQAVRRYHQNLALTDATSIHINATSAQVEVVEWAGSEILIEVTVSSKSGSTAILNHLQKEGRYDLIVTVENGTAMVLNKLAKRQTIKAKGAEMDEQVSYKILVPENYTVTNTSATGAEN
jgi:hypothetical protein